MTKIINAKIKRSENDTFEQDRGTKIDSKAVYLKMGVPATKSGAVANTIKTKIETILNYFQNRSTNANEESFHVKIKLFIANLRGVKEIPFFLFRIEKLFA